MKPELRRAQYLWRRVRHARIPTSATAVREPLTPNLGSGTTVLGSSSGEEAEESASLRARVLVAHQSVGGVFAAKRMASDNWNALKRSPVAKPASMPAMKAKAGASLEGWTIPIFISSV